jgi:hypothetical protein
MLTFLRGSGRASDRKLRLFAVACCRGVWLWLEDEQNEAALRVQEQYADRRGKQGQAHLGQGPHWSVWPGIVVTVAWPGWSFAVVAIAAVERAMGAEGSTCLIALVRDIFRHPSRSPLFLAPSLFDWHDGLIPRMANTIYDDRLLPSGHLDPACLAVLADALEEAGADSVLLDHLRGPGPHVRGCWAIDVLTGRE